MRITKVVMVPFKSILLFSFVSKVSTIDKYTDVIPMGLMSVNIIEDARIKKTVYSVITFYPVLLFPIWKGR